MFINFYYSSKLFALSKANIFLFVEIPTARGTIGVHAVSLDIIPNASCSSCLEEDGVETFQHFLLGCLALARSRLNLETHTFRHAGEGAGIEVKCRSRFLLGSRRFVDT